MCKKSGGAYVLCAVAAAAGVLLGLILPQGAMVFVLCILLIALGIITLI